MKKYIFLFLMMLLSFNVFAGTQYLNFGNTDKFTTTGFNGYIFSSPYKQNFFNITEQTETITNTYNPIITYILNPTGYFDNIIYSFSTNQISLKRAMDLNTYSVFEDDILSQPFVVTRQGQNRIAYLSMYDGFKVIQFVSLNNDFNLINDGVCVVDNNASFFRPNSPSGDNLAYFIPSQNKYVELNKDDCSIIRSVSNVTGIDNDDLIYSPSNEIVMNTLFDDLDNDGKDEVIIFQRNTGITFNVGELKIYKNGALSCSVNLTHTGTESRTGSTIISKLNLGSANSNNEILVFVDRNYGSNGGNYMYIVSSSCGVIFEQKQAQRVLSYPTVGDITSNGKNHLCYLYATLNNAFNLKCIDENANILIDNAFNENAGASYRFNTLPFLASGYFENETNYINFIAGAGIYKFNGTNFIKFVNFSNNILTHKKIPVSLYTKVNFAKDIFTYSETNQMFLYSGIPPAVCGDGVCSSGESLVSCPEDCLISGEDVAFLGVGSICGKNSECFTGNCKNNICEYKSFGENCFSDSECLSKICLGNNKCSKPSAFQSLDNTKNKTLGDDVETDNGLSFLIMIVSAMTGALIGATSKSVYVVGILSVGLFFVSSIVLTLLGWLSPFILIGMILFFLMIVGILIFKHVQG